MKYLFFAFWISVNLFAQKEEANNLVVEGNESHKDEKYIAAEAQYRKAIALDETRTDAQHNLGNTLYRTEDYSAASQRYFLTQKGTENKQEKQAAFHNIGNIHMQAKAYEKAVEAYKQALRNNPTDDETRYNYALAKELLEKQKQEQEQNQDQQDHQDQQDQNQDQNQDQQEKDQNNSDGDQKEDKSEDQQDEGDQKKEEGDQGDKEKEQEKNSDQQKKGKEDKPQKNPPRKPGQISPEQVQSLLKAMNQQEKEVQDKVNAEKVKGVPVKTKKDW